MDKKTKKEEFMSKAIVVLIGAFICCSLWGSAYPCIKIGYRLFCIDSSDTATQLLFAGVRFFLAGMLAVLLGSAVQRRFLVPRAGSFRKIFVLSMLQTVLQYLFFYIGLAHTSGVKASIIGAVNVFVAIVVSSLLFHQEKLNSRKIIGCTIGFFGVVLVNINGVDFNFSLAGEGAIFLSTLAYAFSSVYLKKYSENEDPVMLSGYQFMLGGLMLACTGLGFGGGFTVVSAPAVGMLIYLAIVSAVAYSLWGMLLKYNPVSRVTVYGFMNPIFGVVLSAIFLDEKSQAYGIYSVLALLLVSVGIYVVNCNTNK